MRRFYRSSIVAGVLAAAAGMALPCSADSKITYLLTSPSPNVAEAPHSSVPEVLGYWKDAGLDVDVKPFNGSTGATQLVIAGTAQFTMATPEGLIIARQDGANIVALYNHVREPIYTIAVTEDSPIKKLVDFKGKTIGVLSLSSGALPVDKAMLKSVGLDPEKDVKWLPVGLGPQAAHALDEKQVDGLGLWDWGYAMLENSGHKFRHFSSPATNKLLSIMLIGNQDYVQAHPDETIKFAQGVAKAALFTLTNPEAAVKIHWQKYPSSKPTGIPEAQALKEAVHVLEARLVKYRIAGRAVPKWGAFTNEEWETTRDFLYDAGMIKTKPDVASYYSNRFIDKINDFDAAKIRQQAEAYR